MLSTVKIRLDSESDRYSVYLDSEHKYVFNSKRKAEDYSRFIEHKLREALVFINDRYKEVYSLYRSYFFYVKDFKLRFKIENSLKNVEERLNYIILWNHGENKNCFYMKDIRDCLNVLGSVYTQIRKIAISRRDVAVKIDLEAKCHILQLYIQTFEDFRLQIEKIRFEDNPKILKLWKAS